MILCMISLINVVYGAIETSPYTLTTVESGSKCTGFQIETNQEKKERTSK